MSVPTSPVPRADTATRKAAYAYLAALAEGEVVPALAVLGPEVRAEVKRIAAELRAAAKP